MARTSRTIYTHTCDLCGTEKDEADLKRLFARPVHRGVGIADRAAQADICPACLSKPISAALAFLDGAER